MLPLVDERPHQFGTHAAAAEFFRDHDILDLPFARDDVGAQEAADPVVALGHQETGVLRSALDTASILFRGPVRSARGVQLQGENHRNVIEYGIANGYGCHG